MLERILHQIESATLMDGLADELSPTDLQTLMIEVYRRRAEKLTPARVLQRYREDRFVRPSMQDPRLLLEFDRVAFAAAGPFQPIELAPLGPLGGVSALGTANQNKVVSTSRNTEVVADSTNMMALECAVRRQHGEESVRLCSSHRVTRAQFIDQPNSWAHFKLFSLCTAGRDRGSWRFECEALAEQLEFYLGLFEALNHGGFRVGPARIRLTDFSDIRGDAMREVATRIREKHPAVTVEDFPERESGRGYYREVCFQIHLVDAEGQEQFLVDGGFTDWTQKLLSNKKERLLISGIGTERLCHLFGPSLPQ